MQRRAVSIFLALTVSWWVSSHGQAQVALAPSAPSAAPTTLPDEAPPPEYGQLIESAVAEFDAANYEESRSLFERAHALFPNARSLRGLGKVEFELRNYPASIDFLERALASTVRPLEGALREDTERLLDRARSFVASYDIHVEPADSRVVLDGSRIEPSGPVWLSVGDHVIEAQAQGFVSERRTLRVVGGTTEHVSIVLRAVPKPVASTPSQVDTSPRKRKLWLWTSIGAAVLVGAAVGAVLATRDRDNTERTYSGTSGIVVHVPAASSGP